MNYVALSYSGSNIGDEIQTLAAIQYLPRVDYFIDREELCKGPNIPSFGIFNGWYMNRIHRFIPSPKIIPFYISVHINDERILDRHVIRHLQKHAPIGCRDVWTLKMLRNRGIDSYFSGCLTTTLNKTDVDVRHGTLLNDIGKKVVNRLPQELQKNAEFITHMHKLQRNNINYASSYYRAVVKNLDKALSFAKSHSRYFDELICRRLHSNTPVIKRSSQNAGVYLRLNHAKTILKRYQYAKMVITSRLHCALPCCAFNTPVIMISKNPTDVRFGGLDQIIKIYSLRDIGNIKWQTEPNAKLELMQGFLRKACERAVQLHANPFAVDNSLNPHALENGLNIVV